MEIEWKGKRSIVIIKFRHNLAETVVKKGGISILQISLNSDFSNFSQQFFVHKMCE